MSRPQVGETRVQGGGNKVEWNGRRWVPASKPKKQSSAPDNRSPWQKRRDARRSTKKDAPAVASSQKPAPKGGSGLANLGEKYKEQELKMGEQAEQHRAGSGFSASGRGEVRVNALDLEQTGTNTGFKGSGFSEANAMLQRMGITGVGYGDFETTALPGGRNQPNINTNTENITNKTDKSVEAGAQLQQNGGENLQKPTKETKLTGESPVKASNPVIPGSRAEYDRQFRRSDLSNMQGLRAAEASKGLLYASGKYWRANPSAGQEGQKDFVEISKDEWKAIKSGDQSAQDFASEKIEQVKGGVTLNAAPEGYENPKESKPQFQMPSVPNYQPPTAKVDTEYTLTDAPQFTDKDKTGRYNMFR